MTWFFVHSHSKYLRFITEEFRVRSRRNTTTIAATLCRSCSRYLILLRCNHKWVVSRVNDKYSILMDVFYTRFYATKTLFPCSHKIAWWPSDSAPYSSSCTPICAVQYETWHCSVDALVWPFGVMTAHEGVIIHAAFTWGFACGIASPTHFEWHQILASFWCRQGRLLQL